MHRLWKTALQFDYGVANFEFVNHSEFIDFVRKCAKEVGLDPSEQMINVFVHVFRELYNDKK